MVRAVVVGLYTVHEQILREANRSDQPDVLRIRVGALKRKSVVKASVERGLERMVDIGPIRIEDCGTGANSAVGQCLPGGTAAELTVVDVQRCLDVNGMRPDIAHLPDQSPGKFLLNRKIERLEISTDVI